MSVARRVQHKPSGRARVCWWLVILLLACASPPSSLAADANRLVYLDESCDPYYVHGDFPKLITPQWIGEPVVEAVVTLGIDDLRDPSQHEAYLRPILERLQQIDGRAPVSIMANRIDARHPQLQAWLAEGLSLETHTADHPCPCLQGGQFSKAKSTYDRCVDQLASVPGNSPVAFRFPCMDSLNTPSPRAYAEIINRTTARGNFLQASSSVSCLFTADNPSLGRELVFDSDGRPRFGKYLPFASYVNRVKNYPYPYVIGRLCWEFPCAVPDDWQGNHLHQPQNPQTVADFQAYIDAVVTTRGMANFVFHPYQWMRNDQMISVINYAVEKYGRRIKFLNFRECIERINAHVLAGCSLRAANGQDAGVRILDVNHDGYLDVVLATTQRRSTRIWRPESGTWEELAFPVKLVHADGEGNHHDAGVRFGVFRPDGMASFVVANDEITGVWHFDGQGWTRDDAMLHGLELDGQILRTSRGGRDLGVRLRDMDGDGQCELLVCNPSQRAIFAWDADMKTWRKSSAQLPEEVTIVDEAGNDAGLRFVDIDQDGHDDVVFSNERGYALSLYESAQTGWCRRVRSGKRSDPDAIPMIVRGGTMNGAWFAEQQMWVQNEDTDRLANGVDRRSFHELLGNFQPPDRSPEQSLKSMRPRPGFTIELMAAEPMVMDPVSFDWGPDGRFWVVEMADYPLGLDDQGKPGGRVRYLEDTDGNGSYDKSTLFLDGLSFPTSVMAWRGGVLVTAAPDLIYAQDTDGDGQADRRDVLYRGFREGNQQHRVNGFMWGLDNWVHLANGDSGGKITSLKTGETANINGRDLRIRPDEGLLDPQTGHSQYGRTRDDWGNWFGCNNSYPLRHFVLDDFYLRRNPHLRLPGPRHDIARHDNTEVFPISQILSHWEGYRRPAIGELHRFTSACSTVLYRDDLFGPDFEQNIFTCEPVHNLIHRRVIESRGVTFTSRRAHDELDREFLASTDSWFRPTTVRTGPDGALWIADMYRLVIEHPEWIDDEREKALDLRAGHDKGRIWRIYPRDKKPRPIPHLDQLATPELVSALDSPNGWQRDTVQRLLIHRGDMSSVSPLERMATRSPRPLARLHALCALDGLQALTDQLFNATPKASDRLHKLQALTDQVLEKALSDPHPGVRRHAIRLSENRLDASPGLGDALVRLVDDPDSHVQLQLACSLGEWHSPRAAQVLGRMAARHVGDPYLLAAVVSSLNATNLGGALAAASAASASAGATQPLSAAVLETAAAVGDRKTLAQMVASTLGPQHQTGDAVRQRLALGSILAAMDRRQLAPKQVLDASLLERVRELTQQARQLVASGSADLESRRAALLLLGRDRAHLSQDVSLLVEQLDPRSEVDLQTVALDRLGQIGDVTVAERVLKRWEQLTPRLRAAALDLVLSRTPWITALLDRLEAGDLADASLDPVRREQLVAHADRSVAARAQALFASKGAGSRKGVVERYRPAIGLPADRTRGVTLFVKHCAHCHRLDDVGHEVGPHLATLVRRTPDVLLSAVLDPNEAIEDRFVGYLVETSDGRILSGMLDSETGGSITLKGEYGRQQVILRSDIAALRSTGKSLMPEGMEQSLSLQDMADLLAYVSAAGAPRKRFTGNEPVLVTAATDGSVELAATTSRIHGSTLVFEQQHQNLGSWQSEDDHAAWWFETPAAQTYRVLLHYACDPSTAGNKFLLQVGDQRLTGTVERTSSWDEYHEAPIGTLDLPAGQHQLVLRAVGKPSNCLMDLRALRLVPRGAGQSGSAGGSTADR